jgi:hypothetical protein
VLVEISPDGDKLLEKAISLQMNRIRSSALAWVILASAK